MESLNVVEEPKLENTNKDNSPTTEESTSPISNVVDKAKEVVSKVKEHPLVQKTSEVLKAGYDAGVEMDRKSRRAMDFFDNIQSCNYQRNEEMLRNECYEVEKFFFGIKAGDRGAQWNNGNPIESAKEHARVLEGVLRKGYESIAPEGWKEWQEAKANGASIDELAKLAKVSVNRPKAPNMTFLDTNMKVYRRSDDEINEDLAKYEAKLWSRNFMNVYNAMRPDMSDEAIGIVERAIEGGDGLRLEDKNAFHALNSDEKAKVERLIKMSRPNYSAFWTDLGIGFKNSGRAVAEGVALSVEDAFLPAKTMQKMAQEGRERILAGLEPLTEEEQKLIKGEQDGSAGFASARFTTFGPAGGAFTKGKTTQLSAVDLIAMRHAERDYNAELLVARKMRDQLRRDELQVRLLTERQPYSDYNFIQESIIGAVSTIPYMGAAAIPFVGLPTVAMQQFQSVKDRLIMEGQDPSTFSDGATLVQLSLATAYSLVERLQVKGVFGKPLTAASYRQLLTSTATTAFGKFKTVGANLSREVLAKTLLESVEEGIQGGIERGTIAGLKDKKWDKVISDAAEGCAEDFVQSLGTMGVISVLGLTGKAYRAYTGRFNAEDARDFVSRQLQVDNILLNRERPVSDPQATPKLAARRIERAKEIFRKATEIWRGSESRAEARNQIEDLLGLDEDTTRMVCEWLAERDTILDNLGKNKSLVGAELMAAYNTDNIYEALYRHGSGVDGNWDFVEKFFKDHYLAKGMDEKTAAEQAAYQVKLEKEMAAKGITYRSPSSVFSDSKLLDPISFMRTFINPDLTVEDAEAMIDGKKMKGSAIVIPIKKNDGTVENYKLFSIVRPEGKVDINSDEYATDIENIGAIMLDENGNAITKDKKAVRLTKEVWKGLSKKKKEQQIARHGWKVQGGFRFVAPNGQNVSVNGILSLFSEGGKYTGKSRNKDIAHEIAHALVRFAREAGVIGQEEVETMRQLFGDAIIEGELWNEEKMADMFRDYLQGKVDFGKIQEEYRGIVETVFEAIRKFILDMLRTIGVNIEASAEEKYNAYDAVWKGIMSGDFSKLREFSGVRFKDEGGELNANAGENVEETANTQNERLSLVTPAEVFKMTDKANKVKSRANKANNERLTLIERDDVVNASDYARAFIASSMLQGREVTAKEAAKLLKGLRLPEDKAEEVLLDAKSLASAKARNVRQQIESNDPNLVNDLAKNAMLERFNRALITSFTGGAEAADPVIGEHIEQMRQRQLRRALDSAHGFTQAEMRSELYVNLSAAMFKVAEYEKTPEEKARLAAAKAKRDEERRLAQERGETLEETDEEAMLRLFDEDGNFRVIPEPDENRKSVPESVKKLLDAIMAGADKREIRRKKKEAKKAEAKRARQAANQDANQAGEETESTASPEINFGEENIDETTFDLLKPVFSSPHQFAAFLEEWVFRKLKAKNPKLQGSTCFRDPVNLRELQNTAKDILHNLAKDTLGLTPAFVIAERQINRVLDYKYLSHVHNHIAYVYGRIHENALRINRSKLITDLIKEMEKKTGARGRFSNIEEEKNRKVFAKTVLWVKSLKPYLTMSEEKLNEERVKLEDILSKYNTATQEGAWEADNDRDYYEASLKYALLQQYGGMKRWMVGDIIDASNEILRALDGNIQEFLMRQEERREKFKALRQSIVDALEDGYKYVAKTKGDSVLDKILSGVDSEMGNIELRLKDLIKYCRDADKKLAAEKAIEEIMFYLGRGHEKYSMTISKGRRDINEMLERCYGSANAGIKHLTDALPEDVERAIFIQGGHTLHTYGNLLQLYASCLQKDYHDNVIAHGRDTQIAAMEAALTQADKAFHQELISWYKHNRLELSNAVESITGLPVRSPDEKYVPVKPLNEPEGFKAQVRMWNPITASMTARIRHGLDFDENADILLMVDKAITDRAQIIGYGMTGIFLRDTIAHREVQKAGRMYADKGQMNKIIDQITDTLTQAMPDSGKASALQSGLRQYLSLAYLSWNVVSGTKQLGSLPVWANMVGLRKVAKYMVDVDWGAIQELMNTDGYKARYELGWTPETQELLRNPNPNLFKKFWQKGMCTSRFFDQVASLWMAQGVYRDLKEKFKAELNEDGTRLYTDEEAKERAATITWNWCEQSQQTGRKEFLNEKQRKNSLASYLYQFMSSPLLQLNYELSALRKVVKTKGANGKAELARAVLINHVLVPAIMNLLSIAFQALGLSWRPEDDDDWMEEARDEFFKSMVMGAFAPFWVVCGITEGVWTAATEGNWRDAQALPAAAGIKHIYDAGRLVIRGGKYLSAELGVGDFSDITTDDILNDINKVLRNSFAPYKQADNASRNWTGERLIGE